MKNNEGYLKRRIGSEYGGKTLVDDDDLCGSTIVSAGLGEDASFDTEFATLYGAKVIVVDPTPRAISHFEAIHQRLGNSRTVEYVEGGKQPIEAYELSSLSPETFSFVPKALWTEITTLKFFSPPNPEFVSHSISNFQNAYSRTTDHIEVETTSIRELLSKHDLQPEDLKLIKLDIESAEIEVLADMLDEAIFPKQVLVEFDELHMPTRRGYRRISSVHKKLIRFGYKCIHKDGFSDFLYYRG